jgi:hypothetical protein
MGQIEPKEDPMEGDRVRNEHHLGPFNAPASSKPAPLLPYR